MEIDQSTILRSAFIIRFVLSTYFRREELLKFEIL